MRITLCPFFRGNITILPIPTDDLKCDAPTAFNVHITGTAKVRELLTGNYEYVDLQGDLEGRTTFRWSRGNNKGQSVFITDATKQTYTLTPDDVGFWIFFRVVPRAKTGRAGGNLYFESSGVGPVME